MNKLIFNGTDYTEINQNEQEEFDYIEEFGEIMKTGETNPKLLKEQLERSPLVCGSSSKGVKFFSEKIDEIEVNSDNVFPSMIIVGGNQDFHKRTENKFKRYLRNISA